jgi:hypothetical protein
MSGLVGALKALLAAASILDKLMAFLRDRRQVQAGEEAAAARSLKEQATRVENARTARRAVAPGSLPDDDPYRRD